MIDISGKKYNLLTPIKVVGKSNFGSLIWECICECGNITNVTSGNLRSKTTATISCGCQKHRRKTDDVSNGIWSNLILNAKQRDISILISRKDLYDIFIGQNGLCYLTGEKLIIGRGRKWFLENTASVDRLDSTQPYTKDNCVWCHKKLNSTKNNLSIEEFLCWCKLMQCPLVNNKISPHCTILTRNGIWKTGFGNIRGQFWANIKSNAKKRNIPFNITIEQAWDIFIQQNGKCKITGIDLTFDISVNGSNGTASLDRIDSSKGYNIDNTQWVHKIVNCCFKWNLTEEEMYFWTKKVVNWS